MSCVFPRVEGCKFIYSRDDVWNYSHVRKRPQTCGWTAYQEQQVHAVMLRYHKPTKVWVKARTKRQRNLHTCVTLASSAAKYLRKRFGFCKILRHVRSKYGTSFSV